MNRPGFPSPGDLLTPLSLLLEQVPFAPDTASLDLLLVGREVRTASGQRLSFVPPTRDGLAYEQRIWARGEVATRRDNWHDFFNALVWLTFPQSKAALNARHASAPAGAASEQARGRERDALTHFDECGVAVVASDASLLDLVRRFEWKALFWERRVDLRRALRCFVFGHATYEQLLRPFRGLTAKALLYEVSDRWLQASLRQQLADIDQRLADELAGGKMLLPQAFHPLPLMGLPGVTPASEHATYYDDRWQFRPGRGTRGV